MNVLVLGASGYTGARLVRALLEWGHCVRGLVRDVERGIALEQLGMDLRVGDVLVPESISSIGDEIEIVFNVLAGCRLEPSESKRIMLDGARNIFRIVDRAVLKKYIWTSNVSVYGYPKATERLTETSPLKPAYGLGHVTVEAEKLTNESVPTVTVRVASVYGRGRDSIAALREGRLRLLNDGGNWQSRIHVDDLVQTLIQAMGRGSAGSVYLASDDLPTIQRDFYKEIAAAMAAPAPLSLEANAARAWGVFGRAMNALAGERQYQLSENVIGLATGNYFCLNDKMKKELGVSLTYPTFREGYKAILSGERV
ncbi:MAG TPA: NAD(P)-dependent oxidoreductase [Anaerolineae bacterium]|nr:NAD(P)-dependent oxidoreductase [Anaerolineae bacterium]